MTAAAHLDVSDHQLDLFLSIHSPLFDAFQLSQHCQRTRGDQFDIVLALLLLGAVYCVEDLLFTCGAQSTREETKARHQQWQWLLNGSFSQ